VQAIDFISLEEATLIATDYQSAAPISQFRSSALEQASDSNGENSAREDSFRRKLSVSD
jgi:hypothetical protein